MKRLCLILCVLWASSPQAAITFFGFTPPDFIVIQVGPAVGVETVEFTVPFAQIGSGTPITGTPNVFISALSTRMMNLRLNITVNSQTPLINTSGPSTIPFRDICWTSQDGTIADDCFRGTPNQRIFRFFSGFLITDVLTFSYANTLSLGPGAYEGTVIYNASAP